MAISPGKTPLLRSWFRAPRPTPRPGAAGGRGRALIRTDSVLEERVPLSDVKNVAAFTNGHKPVFTATVRASRQHGVPVSVTRKTKEAETHGDEDAVALPLPPGGHFPAGRSRSSPPHPLYTLRILFQVNHYLLKINSSFKT